MNKLKVFATLTGYQLTWLACIFGESKFTEPLLGVYVGSIYMLLFFFYNNNKKKFLKISLLISIPGYAFDSLMVYFNIYVFNYSIIIGSLPIWMIFLWFSFSTLFDEILLFLKKFKIFGIILSGILGPITYYLGEPLGFISINNIFLFFFLMMLFWITLMIYFLEIILKDYSVS